MCDMQKAVATRLPPKDMVSTVFIFSDMEFDQATTKAGTTYSSPYLGCPSTLAGWPYSIRPSTLARWPRAEEPMEGEQTNFKSVKVSLSRFAVASQTILCFPFICGKPSCQISHLLWAAWRS